MEKEILTCKVCGSQEVVDIDRKIVELDDDGMTVFSNWVCHSPVEGGRPCYHQNLNITKYVAVSNKQAEKWDDRELYRLTPNKKVVDN